MANRRLKTVKPRFWLIMMGAFLVTMTFVFVSQEFYMQRQNERLAQLEEERMQLVMANTELQRQIDYTYTDEYIIREAREKLGLLQPGEILFERSE